MAVVAVMSLLATGCDWAQIRFGPDQRNHNPYEPALTAASIDDLEPTWSRPCACTGVLVAGGIAYTFEGSAVRAFDAATGAVEWSAVVGSNVALAGVGNGLVYLVRRSATGAHQLLARDAVTGEHRFTFTPAPRDGRRVTMGDVIVDGPLAFFVGSVDGSTTVYAVNPSGGLVWAQTPGGFTDRLVADPGKTVYVGTFIPPVGPSQMNDVPLLTGYRQSDGARQSFAVVDVERGTAPAYAFANGLVYTYAFGGHGAPGVGMAAVDPRSGEVRWGHPSEPVVVTPDVLVSHSEVGWWAADPRTGAPLWTGAGILEVSNQAVGVGDLWLRNAGGSLVAHRLSDGTVAGTSTLASNEVIRDVAVSDGRIFLVTTARLVALAPAT